MNIFFLDINPKKSASYYYDKHCIKLILEITQMLYCAHWYSNNYYWKERHIDEIKLDPYRMTHLNHPMTKWVRQSIHNYKFACKIAYELSIEYTRRFKKIHKCNIRIRWLIYNIPLRFDPSIINKYSSTINIPINCTPVPLCMPDQYFNDDLITAYRLYYINDKKHVATLNDKCQPLIIIE